MKPMFQSKLRPKGFNFPNRYYQPEKDETRRKIHFSRLTTRTKQRSYFYYILMLGGVLWLMWYLTNKN